MSDQVTVTIYGVNYTLAGNIEHDYANMLARYVDGKMWELSEEGAIASSTKLAVLVALNIAEEFFKMASSQKKETDNAVQSVNRMLGQLENVLNEELFPDEA